MHPVMTICGHAIWSERHTQRKHNCFKRAFARQAEQVVCIRQSIVRQQISRVFIVALGRIAKINRHDCLQYIR
jgi:hypothetical protein